MKAARTQSQKQVAVREEQVIIPTYEPAAPDLNPMFLEKRVYQGSSGKVYPLPFIDRVAESKTDRAWRAIWLENEYLRVMVLPELGGRIQIAQDKTNGFHFIYHQNVIKPALVGLAGPWISGGLELNWPQHHRPSTFMPADAHVETHPDGSQTVWLSEHDPMARMKGMHGVCLHPGKAYLELKVRVYNRTPFPQTFLWWANVATRVHERYQSFFPPDVHYVADHAKRAVSEFPLCQGFYYGVDYETRARQGVPENETPSQFVPPGHYAPNDLSWYANIPVPTSFMCLGSNEDFFGGYDHAQQAGLVHIANHHISPGKKQWTWGNHEFGYAWDRNLTDHDGPYIELMAGVYTDNQPDFSFLQPGETKSWSQFWYPIQQIGPAHHANLEAAVSCVLDKKKFRLGVSVSAVFPQARIRLEDARGAAEWVADLAPGKPFVVECAQPRKPWKIGGTTLLVLDRKGREIIRYTPKLPLKAEPPKPATEPPAPEHIASADELFITGLHLDQYRHATRCPTVYWREALRRDPLDSRCNNALGLWHLRRGEFDAAERHFRTAIARSTQRNPNPPDGEVFYNLGLCLRYQLDALANFNSVIAQLKYQQAYAAFYKSTWNHAWQSAAYHALAEMDCRRADWTTALDHLNRSLRLNPDHLRARALKAIVLRKLGRNTESDLLLKDSLALDPLDWWARHLLGESLNCDNQVRLDLALDFARAGLYAEAVPLLQAADPNLTAGTAPLVHYYLGWLHEKMAANEAHRSAPAAITKQAMTQYRQAARQRPDYCFPARLEEISILKAAIAANPQNARASYYLGNLFYDRRRHLDALAAWEKSAQLDPSYSVVWRNLGIGYFNIAKQPAQARAAYEKALRANPEDARLLYERDQLWKRLRERPEKRLRALAAHLELVRQRDDLSLELCALYNLTGQPAKARQLLARRHFQPWEGGEGLALEQHVRTQLAFGQAALARQDYAGARSHFEAAFTSPANLGEAKHPLANQSDIHYWLGVACSAMGDQAAARKHWTAAATFKGDFQQMSVRAFSERTFYSALAWGRLGQKLRRRKLLRELLAYARNLQQAQATIDYFATSLPTMLLFADDIQYRQETTALFLQAQAHFGLGNKARARQLLDTVLKRDPSHALAIDLRRFVSGPLARFSFGAPVTHPKGLASYTPRTRRVS